VPSTDKVWKIEEDWEKIPPLLAKYLVAAMNFKGNLVMDRGLPGAPISKVIYDGGRSIIDQYKDIKIVGEYDGQYAQGPAEQGMSSVLAANPKVDGVFTQGYIISIINALKKANLPMVPMSEAINYNIDLVGALDNNVNFIAYGNITGLGAMALKTAVDILEGGNPPKSVKLDPIFLATDTSIDIGVPLIKIEFDKTAFKDYPPGFIWPVFPADFPVQLTPEEVVKAFE
ncbi:MAG: substrate-binding domain-containing protein, partial [Actinobacteria bacterium]|nr:substrate-binding domain-containing protein [Actinomycetota bacterium]